MGGKETFENLTQMVDHYQKESDGLVTRLQIPVVKTSGKVKYSVDAEDFKTCKSGGWDAVGVWGTVGCLGHSQVSGKLCYVGTWTTAWGGWEEEC